MGIEVLKKLGFCYAGGGEFICELKNGISIVYMQSTKHFEFYKGGNIFPFIETDDIIEFLNIYESLIY